MDVGAPSNFVRVLDLYGNSWEAVREDISGATCSDSQIRETIKDCYDSTGYILDPHGACGYRALRGQLREGQTGVFLETAHPAKFKENVDAIIGAGVQIPQRLQDFMKGTKQTIRMPDDFGAFKSFLMQQH